MNIQQASIYSGLSESTLRRKIYQGKLPVQKIEGRYEIAMSDLDALQAQPASDTLSIRLTDLERRVHVLEATITAMSSNTYPAQKHAPRLLHDRSGLSESNTLPDGWISLTTFCDLHNIAETTARRYLNPEMVKKGTWEHDHSLVKVALDSKGQHHLWNIFHNKTRFKPCDRCPHE